MYKQVLLFSGGLDSFIAYHLLNKPKAIHFDIGTRYSIYEKETALKLVPDCIVDESLNFLGLYENLETSEIPMRNLFTIMVCAVKYSTNIIIGSMADDYMGDNRKDNLQDFATLLSKISNRDITVTSPFWNMTKAEAVQEYVKNFGSQGLLDTYSCFETEEACNSCISCLEKNVALFSGGIFVPFYNMELLSEKAKAHSTDTWINYYEAVSKV